jgi:UDP-GlcNAc:undecaprenyl-phosphate/decaprenyl-phosphate GlcNAc-1-phosphate transferase
VTQQALEALPAIVAALAIATVVSYLLTPLAIRFAPRLGAIDVPNAERRVHEKPIPRTGGLAVAATFVGVGLAGIIANNIFQFAPALRAVRIPEVFALFAGVSVGAVLGYLDDRLELRARWQFISQFVLAGIALLGSIRIERLPNPFGENIDLTGTPLLEAAAIAATTIWVVGMINSANFVDGLDGLLAGIALIAVTTLGVTSLIDPSPQPAVALLCALLAGSLLGFLPYNFHPARVFIGTAGVFAVGYALAVLSIVGTAKVAVALLVLGVPVIDTFWIILRRVAQKRSPFSADRGHFHHRLLDMGLSHRSAVLTIYAICVVLAALSVILSGRGQISAFLVIVLIGGMGLYLMTRRARESLDRSSYPDDPSQGTESEVVPPARDRDSSVSEFRSQSRGRA